MRIARKAHGRAEFHDRLVVIAGILAVEQFVRESREPLLRRCGLDLTGIARQAAEHSSDIAIEDRVRQIEAMLATAAAV